MSETIKYNIHASGFQSMQERDEFLRICRDFADHGEIADDSLSSFHYCVDEGWRGGGKTCEEILRGEFGEWTQKHTHVHVVFWCTYLEHPPREQIAIGLTSKPECGATAASTARGENMGYAHYWRTSKELDSPAFQKVVQDFRRMLPVLDRLGIKLAGCGELRPSGKRFGNRLAQP